MRGEQRNKFRSVQQRLSDPHCEITAIAHVCVKADTATVASSPTLETGCSPKALHTPASNTWNCSAPAVRKIGLLQKLLPVQSIGDSGRNS